MQNLLKSFIVIFTITILLSSCTKEDNSSNNNISTVTPVAATGTIMYNGKVYPINRNMGTSKQNGAYIQNFDASTADSTIVLALMFTDSLPTAKTYKMGNNITPMAADKYGFSINYSSKSTFAFYYHISLENKGGADVTVVKNATNRQYIGNNLQAFTTNLSNASLLSFNIIVND